MDEIKFKAKVSHASKVSAGKYYMLGFADGKYDYENYILFQKSYDPDDDDGIFCDCNGAEIYNKVKYVIYADDTFETQIDDTVVTVDISNVKINEKKFTEYVKIIFGNKLKITRIIK
jgi:hypothetical protein